MKATISQQASVNRHIAAVGSGPRTRLPFLRKVVQNASRSPNTQNTPTPFKSYPLLTLGEEKQRTSKILYKDSKCTLVNDAFPKSRVHCLIIPLDLSLESLNSLRSEHIPLLRHMMEVAQQYLQFLKTNAPEKGYNSLSFTTGFHALPSLPQLHMHLISMDFDSPCLKTKKHYNSFTTEFFLPAEDVLEDVEKNGFVTLNQNISEKKRMEEQPLRCLWCNKSELGMPQLKAHLRECSKSRAFIKPVNSNLV